MWPNLGDARTASRFGCRIVMRFVVTRTWTVGNVELDDSVRRGNFCGSRRNTTQLPIDIWIDSFEPRHSKNHLIGTERSNEKGFLVFNTSESKLELDHAIGMKQLCAVRDGDID